MLTNRAAPRDANMAAVAPPVLRACGALTSDPAVYAESLRQLAIQRVVVATGCCGRPPGRAPRGQQQGAAEAPRGQRVVEIASPGLSVTPAALALAAVVLLEEGGAVGARGFVTPVGAAPHLLLAPPRRAVSCEEGGCCIVWP